MTKPQIAGISAIMLLTTGMRFFSTCYVRDEWLHKYFSVLTKHICWSASARHLLQVDSMCHTLMFVRMCLDTVREQTPVSL